MSDKVSEGVKRLTKQTPNVILEFHKYFYGGKHMTFTRNDITTIPCSSYIISFFIWYTNAKSR